MCIANGKFEMLMYSGRRSSEFDQVTSIIYGRITKMIRTRLDDLQKSEIDALLLCVGALANFDSLSMKKDVLDNHRSATHQLVAAKGGVHNLDWLTTLRHAVRYENGCGYWYTSSLQQNEPQSTSPYTQTSPALRYSVQYCVPLRG